MHIQLASDLHLEHLSRDFPGETLIRPEPQADVLVLAGDIGHAAEGLKLFQNWPVPVIYVMGNHEAYGSRLPEVREHLRRAAEGTSVRVLEQESLEIEGVRFLGTTLWTDYRYPCNLTRAQAMAFADRRLADHRYIQMGEGTPFLPQHALAEHERSRAWLEQELAKPHRGKTVVVTHHAPHLQSVHPRWAGDPLTAAFVSDLTELLSQVDIWLHGHVHDNFDYRVGRCRVMANPRGYPLNRSTASDVSELTFENAGFVSAMLVSTDSPVGELA